MEMIIIVSVAGYNSTVPHTMIVLIPHWHLLLCAGQARYEVTMLAQPAHRVCGPLPQRGNVVGRQR